MPSVPTILSTLDFLASPSTETTGESSVITVSPSLHGHEELVALLPTVVHHDVDSRVVLLHPGRAAAGKVVPGVGAGHDRDELPAAAEEAVQHAGRHVVQVLADQREVAGHDPEDVTRLAGAGHRHRLPGGDRDGAVAGVPRGGG